MQTLAAAYRVCWLYFSSCFNAKLRAQLKAKHRLYGILNPLIDEALKAGCESRPLADVVAEVLWHYYALDNLERYTYAQSQRLIRKYLVLTSKPKFIDFVQLVSEAISRKATRSPQWELRHRLEIVPSTQANFRFREAEPAALSAELKALVVFQVRCLLLSFEAQAQPVLASEGLWQCSYVVRHTVTPGRYRDVLKARLAR